ncbi:MAG: MFS transporter [Deltaproteobacteria bacterium]|nr:MFS transporter [Deltaproteobacteria bacterium]MBI3386769.1 MFS transporter [Deltaproteobacteria bacterium]
MALPALSEPIPPLAESNSRYSSYVLAVLVLVYIFNFIDRQILAILLQPIKDDLHISDTALGFLSGFAFAAFYTTMGIPLARLGDVWVRRSLIALGLAVWSGMTALCGSARSFTELALARIGVGIGEASCTPAAHSLLSDYFPPHRRATALSIYSAGIYIGVGIGFWLGGWVNDALGWRAAFLVVGLPGCALAVLVRLTIREPIRGAYDRVSHAGTAPRLGEVLGALRGLRAFWLLSFAGAFQAFGSYGLGNWIAVFYIRVHHMKPAQLGVYLALITASSGACGSFLGGWSADRLQRRNPRARFYVAAFGAALGAPLNWLVLLQSDASVALALAVPAGLCNAMWLGPSASLVQEMVVPEMRAVAASVFLFIVNLIGLGAGPQTVGILNDLFGHPESIRYSLMLVVLGNGLAAVLFVRAARAARLASA